MDFKIKKSTLLAVEKVIKERAKEMPKNELVESIFYFSELRNKLAKGLIVFMKSINCEYSKADDEEMIKRYILPCQEDVIHLLGYRSFSGFAQDCLYYVQDMKGIK